MRAPKIAPKFLARGASQVRGTPTKARGNGGERAASKSPALTQPAPELREFLAHYLGLRRSFWEGLAAILNAAGHRTPRGALWTRDNAQRWVIAWETEGLFS